ncbi:MAG: carboxylate transporter, partial [Phycisphaerae bacterium]|nr:carboxylate transporter [Phycisphaerae bacterium]NIX28213.1 carboxylate transporter [Phycisphaerae bacterium]
LILIFLPAIWIYLVKYHKIKGSFSGSREIIVDELHALGPMTKAEKRVLIIFIITALGWIFRKDFQFNDFTIPGWASLMGVGEYVHDSTVAVFSTLLMFLI